MGVRQRVVRQTITETVCDVCKKAVDEGEGFTGTLSVKATGARGRARQVPVAFHGSCLSNLTNSSGSAAGGRAKSGRKAAKRTGAAKNGRKKRTSARKPSTRKTSSRKAGTRKKSARKPSNRKSPASRRGPRTRKAAAKAAPATA